MKVMVRALVVLGFAGLFGCAEKTRETAFSIIDGHPITESFVRDTVRVMAKISEIAGRPIKADQFAAWGNRRAMKIIPQLQSAYLLEREIRRQGVVPTAEDCQKVLDGYNRMTKKRAKRVEELMPLFGELADFFKLQFERECLFAAYSRQHFESAVNDKDIERYYRSQTNALRRAERIDQRARRRSDEAWAKLCAGTNWVDVAKDYSEDVLVCEDNADFYQSWGNFRVQDFAENDLGALLPLMKAGTFSKPVETDEGMMIVRVNEVDGELYDLGRILFRMAAPVEVLEPEAARRHLSKERADKAQVALLTELVKNAKIEYPLGTNFTYQIWAVKPSPNPIERMIQAAERKKAGQEASK